MSVALYMDVHVRRSVTDELRRRGVDVLTAQQDGMATASDLALLDRATEIGRVLFSRDVDLLVEAASRQRAGTPFAGLIYAHQQDVPIGRCIEDLEIICAASCPGDFADWVEYLPL